MKFLLSIFSVSCLFASSYLNTNLVFQTNNLVTNLKTKLKTKKAPLSFLYQNNSKNKLTKKFLANSKFSYLANDLESSYFNDVLLKSIAYDKTSLKLTSSIANLKNYALKHHENKIDTYLDIQDYSKMLSIKNKKNSNSIIAYNLAFLNHFFNNKSLKFNPNGFIISRSKLLSASAKNLKVQNQSIFQLNTKTKQNSLNGILKKFNASKNNDFSLNVSWSGINFDSGSKLLTQQILHNLNASATLTNLITLGFQNGKKSLKSTNKLNGIDGPWSPFDFMDEINYLFGQRTWIQNSAEYPEVKSLFSQQFDQAEFEQMEQKFNQVLYNLYETDPYKTRGYAQIIRKAMVRFGKEKLSFNTEKDPLNGNLSKFSNDVPKQAQDDLNTFNENAAGTSTDVTSDVDAGVAEVLEAQGAGDVASEVASGMAEAGAACQGVPIIGWIIGLIILAITITISVVISQQLKKINNWNINVGNLTPKGPWSLNNLRFDKKTRLFKEINSSQIQFSGQYFKPWFGKVTHKIFNFKPLHALTPNKKTKTMPSIDLQNQYNLLSGNNNNFNLIVNPTTWKQMIAAANMPSAQFSVKEILAKNNVNSNNLYLSNQNWVDLIKQVKNPALNQNYAGDFKFKDSKLSYSNLTSNHQSNFKYSDNFNLKEMIVGNNKTQDFLINHKQLKFLINGLNYLKNRWNNSKALNKQGKPLFLGIKNSIQYNPKGYKDFITWYYYYQLKPYIWVDSNSCDQVNIAFLKRIFNKLKSNKFKLSFKQGLNLVNNNSILDLSSSQF